MTPILTDRVACNGCTACCRGDLIFLHPECGDDPRQYLTKPAMNPITGKQGLALQHKADGSCVYLGEHGCTIHGRHPAICREFNCAKLFASLSRQDRRRYIRKGLLSAEVMAAGRERSGASA